MHMARTPAALTQANTGDCTSARRIRDPFATNFTSRRSAAAARQQALATHRYLKPRRSLFKCETWRMGRCRRITLSRFPADGIHPARVWWQEFSQPLHLSHLTSQRACTGDPKRVNWADTQTVDQKRPAGRRAGPNYPFTEIATESAHCFNHD